MYANGNDELRYLIQARLVDPDDRDGAIDAPPADDEPVDLDRLEEIVIEAAETAGIPVSKLLEAWKRLVTSPDIPS